MRGPGNCLRLIGVNRIVYYFAIWSIWSQLSFLYRLYWLLLCLISLYALFSVVSIVRRFPPTVKGNDSSEHSRILLEARITNLQQVITAMFFAFGALFFGRFPGRSPH
jgi:hypothetical protein